MKKNPFVFLSAVALVAMTFIGCTEPVTPEPDNKDPEQQEPEKLELLKLNVPVVNNWVWDARPEIVIEAENINAVAMEAAVKVTISTDKGEAVEVIEFTDEIPNVKLLGVFLLTIHLAL